MSREICPRLALSGSRTPVPALDQWKAKCKHFPEGLPPSKKSFQLLSYCNNPAASSSRSAPPPVSYPSAATSTPQLLTHQMPALPCMVHTHTLILTLHKIKTTMKQHCLAWRSSSCTLPIPLQILHRLAVQWGANLRPLFLHLQERTELPHHQMLKS